MRTSLCALSLATLALAQPPSPSAPTWYGLVPGGGAGGYALVELNDDAAITRPVATIATGAGEVADADAMRCLFGFCAFMATTASRGATYAYRVNTSTGALLDRTPLPGACPHLHVDYTSGNLYTLCSDGKTSRVFEVSGDAPTLVLDVTAQVAGGRTLPGQTTHCSAFKSMYIGVDHGGKPGADSLVTVDLAAARAQVLQLRDPLWRALWARCDGSNEVGGVAFAPAAAGGGGNGTATFGTVDTASGAFRAWASVGVPAGVEPTGLLTETETEQALAAFYPPRGSPASAKGYLWAVDPFAKTGDDFVAPIPFLLVAASFDRDGKR